MFRNSNLIFRKIIRIHSKKFIHYSTPPKIISENKVIILGGFFQKKHHLQKYVNIYNNVNQNNVMIENNILDMISPNYGHEKIIQKINGIITHEKVKQPQPIIHFISASVLLIRNSYSRPV